MRILRLAVGLSVAVILTGCASSGAVYTPKPFPMPGGGTVTTENPPAPTPSAPAPVPPSAPGSPVPTIGSPDGYALSSTALSLRGAPYRNGGIDPNGFDCSGFVQYVFGQNGVAVPREVREQYRLGKGVNRDHLEPGDLVFFKPCHRARPTSASRLAATSSFMHRASGAWCAWSN